MKKVDLLIRVSTDEQADKGYSQRDQEERLRRYCEIYNYQIRRVIIEDYSAKTFDRPEFSKLLLNYKKEKPDIDFLLFTKWSRFIRNMTDGLVMIRNLTKLGIEPNAIEQRIDFEVPQSKYLLAFYLAEPEVENDVRSINVSQGMRQAKKEGRYMGCAPFGYKNKVNEQGRKYIAIDEDKAPMVRWIFQELATGKYSAESILKMARRNGFTCKKNAFWNMLRNTAYCSIIKVPAFKGDPEQLVAAKHEPLISKELFYQVQDILAGKKKVQRTKIFVDDKFPLRGFITCPRDGKLLTASSSKGRKQYYDYYHCTSDCGVRYKADLLNESVVAELKKWKPNPAVKQLYKLVLQDVHTQQQRLQQEELQTIKSQLAQMAARQKKALELLMADKMEADDYKAIKRDCEQAAMILEEKMAGMAEIPNIQPLIDKGLDVLEHIDQAYTAGSTQVKRNIIGSMFPDRLEFDGEHYRTARVNEAVRIIFNIGEAFAKIKLGQVHSVSDLSQEVNPLVHFSNLFLSDLKKLAALAA